MRALEKKISTKTVAGSKRILDNSIPDLSKHPVILKKTDEARAFLKQHPISNDLISKVK